MKENALLSKYINEKNQKNRNSFGFLIWFLKVFLIIIVTLALIKFVFILIPDMTKYFFRINFENIFSKHNFEEQEYKELLDSINENKQLSFNEKEFIVSIAEKEFSQNNKYIDINLIKERLNNFKIIYGIKKGYNINGKYNSAFNEIYICRNSHDLTRENKEILIHEFNHLLTKNSINTNIVSVFNKNNNSILNEITNELFAREYYEENNSKAYNESIMYLYSLLELLDKEIIKEYKFSNNEMVIVNALREIDEDDTKIFELLNSIENRQGKVFVENYNYFYTKKYGCDFTNNLKIVSYLSSINILTKKQENNLLEKLGIENNEKIISVNAKNYINEDENKNVVVKYEKDGELKSINL